MRAEQFIKDHGLERARELLKADKDYKTYCLIDKSFWSETEGVCSFCVDLDQVKRLVESVDIVKAYGGIEQCRNEIEWVVKTKLPETNLVKELKQAIADYESIYGEGNE